MPTDGRAYAAEPHPAPNAPHVTVTMEDVREHLTSWRPTALVDLIMEQARENDRLLYGAVDRYEPVLGEAGLAAYREAVERRWASVVPLGPGESDPEQYAGRLRLTQMMKGFIELSG